ncbi:MAG: thioredoxin family protein [Myxococcota bacterium]
MRFLLAAMLLGCGAEAAPVPESQPFTQVSDDVLRSQVQGALQTAKASDRRVLLVFVADWCEDCHEVVRILGEGPQTRREAGGYEIVYVDIGRRDRHLDWVNHYRVERIATLVALDAEGQRIAQTTLEPISTGRGLQDRELAAWLAQPRDAWSGGAAPPSDVPLFPPEILQVDG